MTLTRTDTWTASRAARLNRALLTRVAEAVERAGCRTIALYGGGMHTRAIIREPWVRFGITVKAVLDDDPSSPHIAGVPVVHPSECPEDVQAIVLSSDAHEQELAAAVQRHFDGRLPVFRIYTRADDDTEAGIEETLIRRFGIDRDDAAWLMANRYERHDATLPMLPPERTEMHLRRYEFALAHAAGRRVLDAASGTGYGSRILMLPGGASEVVGVEIDPRAADYATRRHGQPGVTFIAADATDTPFPDRSFDLITSFETIEHLLEPGALLDEFSRLLRPGGMLILSTPNDWGLTEFHHQSFTHGELEAILRCHFSRLEWFGQVADDEPRSRYLPPGIFRLEHDGFNPETFMVVAQR